MEDISHLLRRWPFDPARVQARLTPGADGRPVLQLRVELGILQMERDGRPDGSRPGGHASLLEQYGALAERIVRRGGSGRDFEIPPEDFKEIDREILQYYHRRLALMSLGDYARAARDADHSLGLIDLLRRHSKDPKYVARHERSVPYVLTERARARALLAMKRHRPVDAVASIEEGITRIQEYFREAPSEADGGAAKALAFLRRWARKLRRAHGIEPPLDDQLAEAVRSENYEEAARLRDEIRRRGPVDKTGPA
jgi:hypothetical protein